MTVHPRLLAAATRLEDWIRHQALPLWRERGMSPEPGGHWERLLADGTPDRDANVRLRVQARQAFVFAAACGRGWYPEGEAPGRQLLALMDRVASLPGGGYGHLMNNRFELLDRRQDLYDHAFYILANAWAYRAWGDTEALARAEALVRHIDRRLAADHGGWLEGDYPAEHRRQNPHMHLLEAFLSLYEATFDARWLARAGEIVTLFETRFYDPGARVLREYFTEDWWPAAGEAGELVEPGHMLEWVWLLNWYGRCSGRDLSRYSDALYDQALVLGLADSGLLWDAVDARGRVLQASHRCWPMTELIKACLVRARAGDPDAEERAAAAIDALFAHYLNTPTPGAYVDRLDARGERLVDLAPASSLYHLLVAALEVADYCGGDRGAGQR